ncbi:MAG: hypothetical protein ABIM98_07405 [candidate division WOR-3 bacterium]
MRNLIEVINFIEKEFPSLSDAERWRMLKFLLDGKMQKKIVQRQPTSDSTLSTPKIQPDGEVYEVIMPSGTKLKVGKGYLSFAEVLRQLGFDYRKKEEEARRAGKKSKICPKTYFLRHWKDLGVKEVIKLK